MAEKRDFSHIDDEGRARMVDVGGKAVTTRVARAGARIEVAPETLRLLRDKALPKGDVLSVARVAGIMAAKQTASLIPMCHPLAIEHIAVVFEEEESAAGAAIGIEATIRVSGKTGVEMEALTAAAVAALTIYDMCKAVDKTMVIGSIELLEKRGGKSG